MKWLMYHGWSDPVVPPRATIDKHARIVAARGGPQRAAPSMRLFMAPGLGHFGGGDGPNTFDMIGALDRWVERGEAPDRIVASHATNGRVDRTRPLCPYPRIAIYNGSGTDDEAHFSCGAGR